MFFKHSDIVVIQTCGSMSLVLLIVVSLLSLYVKRSNEISPSINIAMALPIGILATLDLKEMSDPSDTVFVNILAFTPILVLVISMHVRICVLVGEDVLIKSVSCLHIMRLMFNNIIVAYRPNKVILVDCLFISGNILVVTHILYRYFRNGNHGMKYSVAYYLAFVIFSVFANIILAAMRADYAAFIAIYAFVIPTSMAIIDFALMRREWSIECEVRPVFSIPVTEDDFFGLDDDREEEVEMGPVRINWMELRKSEISVLDQIRILGLSGQTAELNRITFLHLVDRDEKNGVWMKMGEVRTIYAKYVLDKQSKLIDISDDVRLACVAKFDTLNNGYSLMSNSESCMVMKTQSPFVDVVAYLVK